MLNKQQTTAGACGLCGVLGGATTLTWAAVVVVGETLAGW